MRDGETIFGVVAVLASFLFWFATCSGDKAAARRVLEDDGCTEIQVGGWDAGCGDDWQANTFTCNKNGRRVSGVVCSGLWLKARTIRFN